MKNTQIYQYFIAVLFVIGCSITMTAQTAKQTKPVVMILGSYHMGNPGLDVNNIKADDVLAEKRQKEITEFVAQIKKFRPTKIAIEVPAENTKYTEKYTQYLKNNYTLTANEVDQIAFRLAKELNHPRLYQIDWKGNFDLDKVLASAAANNQTAMTEKAKAAFQSSATAFADQMKKGSVTELLRFMNDENQVEKMHAPYLWTVNVGKDKQYEGADLAADWYERNLKIFANIMRITESSDDRILALIGAGHLKLLQQFVTESGEYDLERLSKYL
ncbi:MAG: DUF5694 domain-containing protein [Pyrinomonadaceae bacterium]